MGVEAAWSSLVDSHFPPYVTINLSLLRRLVALHLPLFSVMMK